MNLRLRTLASVHIHRHSRSPGQFSTSSTYQMLAGAVCTAPRAMKIFVHRVLVMIPGWQPLRATLRCLLCKPAHPCQGVPARAQTLQARRGRLLRRFLHHLGHQAILLQMQNTLVFRWMRRRFYAPRCCSGVTCTRIRSVTMSSCRRQSISHLP